MLNYKYNSIKIRLLKIYLLKGLYSKLIALDIFFNNF